MRPDVLPQASTEELRAAIRAFAAAPSPARFHRVVRLLERHGDGARGRDGRRR